jgi:hypothetical protein
MLLHIIDLLSILYSTLIHSICCFFDVSLVDRFIRNLVCDYRFMLMDAIEWFFHFQ